MMNFKNKRILSLFLSLALMLGLFLIPMENKVFAEEVEDGVKNLVIMHTNDVHGNVEEAKYNTMGAAKMFTKIKEIREENPETSLLLDAGDAFHGQPFATMFEGESMVRLMNTMGYDAMVAGNHDFDYGYERLLELKEIAEFPILGANIVREDDGSHILEKYVIKELDGVKVGIFGLTTPETGYKTKPTNVEGLIFKDIVEVGKEMVAELEKEEVDIIVALVHLGVEGDDTSIKLAEEVEGIDIIVDGHSHTKLEEGKLVGNILIAQTEEKGNNLGIVNIEFDGEEIVNKEAQLFLKDDGAELEEDADLKTLIEEIDEEMKPELETVLGKAIVDLDGERETARTGETNLGNLLTDMMLKESNADIAMTNGGGIRASIKAGDITKGDVLEAFSFDNIISVIEVTGAEVKAALEHGISDYPEPKGAFPHVAGMTYKFDQSKGVGERVTEILIKDEPIDLEKNYTLATNDFMAIGGDDYTMFIGKESIAEYDALNQLLMNYIEELGEIDIGVEGRIIVEGELPEQEEVEEVEEPQEEVPELEPVEEPEPEVIVPPVEKEPIIEAYIVKAGDVLWKIADKFNTTWENLAEYNKLKNPHLIFPGQKILIPAK